MNKVKLFLFFVLFSLLFVLAGCGESSISNGAIGIDNPEQSPIEIPYAYEKQISDRTNINAEIEVPDTIREEGFYTASAELLNYDDSQVEGLFWNKDNTKEEMYPEDGGKAIYGLNGDFLFVSSTYLSYYTSWAQYPECAFYSDIRTEDYNRNLYKKDMDFSFKSREEVKEELDQVLNQLGVEEAVYDFYALDYQTMESEAIVYDIDGGSEKPDYSWSEKDNCYYIYICQTCNGVPLLSGRTQELNEMVKNHATVDVLYNMDGIAEFWGKYLYKIKYDDKIRPLYDFDAIVSVFQQKQELMLAEYDTVIDSISLYALPTEQKNGTYEIQPVWIFSGNSYWTENGEDYTYPYAMIIDAVSGEEITE